MSLLRAPCRTVDQDAVEGLGARYRLFGAKPGRHACRDPDRQDDHRRKEGRGGGDRVDDFAPSVDLPCTLEEIVVVAGPIHHAVSWVFLDAGFEFSHR